LSPDDASRSLDREHLRAALQARARDLASPGGFAVEPLIARDPTLLTLELAESWQPADEPRREYDVWFDAAGERAYSSPKAKPRRSTRPASAPRSRLSTLRSRPPRRRPARR
jgi:predicted exporter